MGTLAQRADNEEARARIAEAKARTAAAKAVVGMADGIKLARRVRPMAASGSFKSNRGRLNTSTKALYGSSNYHRDSTTREAMGRECSDVLRNNPLAQMLVDRKAQLLLGDGPRFTSDCADPEFKVAAQKLMDEWANGTGTSSISAGGPGAASLCGRFTLTDLLHQAVFAAHEHGRMAMMLVSDPDRGGRPALQPIEDPRIINPGRRVDGARTQDEGRWVNGVKLSSTGRAVAYGIGEYDDFGGYVKTQIREVSARYVLDLTPPVTRGLNTIALEPLLWPVVGLLEQWDEAVDATVVAYRVATFFAAIHSGGSPLANALGTAQSSVANSQAANAARALDQRVLDDDGVPDMSALEPGMIQYLDEGNVTQLRPEHPVTGLTDMDRMLLGKMAAALGLSVDAVTFDYDGNWSASRARLTMVWRAHGQWRMWLLRHLHAIARWRLAWAIRAGELPEVEGWDRMSWRLAEQPLLDPEKEVKAALDAVGGMLKSRGQVLADMNLPEFERVAAELAAEQRLIEESGLTPEPRQGTAVSITNNPEPKKKTANKTDGKTDSKSDAGSEPAIKSPFLIGDKTLATDLSRQVVNKDLPSDTASAILEHLVGIDPEVVSKIIGPAATYTKPVMVGPDETADEASTAADTTADGNDA